MDKDVSGYATDVTSSPKQKEPGYSILKDVEGRSRSHCAAKLLITC